MRHFFDKAARGSLPSSHAEMLPHFSFRTCVQIQQVSDVDQVFLHLGAYGTIRFLPFSTSVYGHGFSIHVLPKRKKLFGNSRGQRSVEERKTYPFRRFSVRPTYGRTLPQNVGTDPRLLESGRGNDYPLSKKCVKQKIINLRKRVSVTEPLRPSRFVESIPGNGRSAGLFGDPNSKPTLLDEGRKFEPVDTANRNRVAQGSFSVEGEGGKAFFFTLGRFGRLGASFSKTRI